MDIEATKGKLDEIVRWIEKNAPEDQRHALFKEMHYAREAAGKDDQSTAETHLTNLGQMFKKIKSSKTSKTDINALLKDAKKASAAPKPRQPLPKSALAYTPQNTQMPFSKPGKSPGSLGRDVDRQN